MKTWPWVLAAGGSLWLMGCKTEHTIRVEPIEVRPMTLNINIRVQRELDEFFDFQDQPPATPQAQGSQDVPAGAPRQGVSP